MVPIYLVRQDEELGAVRVDRFLEPSRAVSTVAVHTADFVGTITVSASIELEPTDSDWFVIFAQDFVPVLTNEETGRNVTANAVGRFVWMKVTITRNTIPKGIVDRVTVN